MRHLKRSAGQLLSDPKGAVPALDNPNVIANGKNIILFLDNDDDPAILQFDFNFPGRPGPSCPLTR